jgi:hypothetical protein
MYASLLPTPDSRLPIYFQLFTQLGGPNPGAVPGFPGGVDIMVRETVGSREIRRMVGGRNFFFFFMAFVFC